MINPKVSIIIPVFNPDIYFNNCLDSVINQTMENIEIICVDDGSTDGSWEILEEYARKDDRFKIFKQKNSGAGIARNKAIENSSGEYILFLDSDDWIEKDACEKLYGHAKKLNSDLVIFDTIWHLEGNNDEIVSYFEDNTFKKDYDNFTFDFKFVKSKMMDGMLGVIWSKFYKSSLIKGNNIKFPAHKIYNDVEFHFKTMLLSNNISFYPKVFYHYLKLGQPSLQTSFRKGKHDMLWFDVIMGIRKFLLDFDFMVEMREEFIKYVFYHCKNKLQSINYEFRPEFFNKLKYFFESLEINFFELELVDFTYATYYIHIINAETYGEFKYWQDIFDGNLNFKNGKLIF